MPKTEIFNSNKHLELKDFLKKKLKYTNQNHLNTLINLWGISLYNFYVFNIVV